MVDLGTTAVGLLLPVRGVRQTRVRMPGILRRTAVLQVPEAAPRVAEGGVTQLPLPWRKERRVTPTLEELTATALAHGWERNGEVCF